MATSRGVFKLHKVSGKILRTYTPIIDFQERKSDVESAYLYNTLSSDKSETIWLGSYTALAKFSNGKWTVFRPKKKELTEFPEAGIQP